MTTWLKTFRKGNQLSPSPSPGDGPLGETITFYEPLSTYSDGTPKLTRHGEPMGKPNYDIGDLIASYWTGTYEVGEVFEVIGEPEQADRVGWAWQTDVKRVARREPGVSLDELDINPRSLPRRVRLRFDDEQAQRLEQAFEL
jgi:hypothetical protein